MNWRWAALALSPLPGLLWLWPILAWPLAALAGVGSLLVLLTSPWYCAAGATLFMHLGILAAVKVGFTFKASQLFALLGVGAWGARRLAGFPAPALPWKGLLPFALFFVAVLPSLLNTDAQQVALAESQTSVRLILNYVLLQAMALVIYLAIDSRQRFMQIVQLSFASCAISLIAGFAQQIGFYAGVYNPFNYLGIHSSIVDFYGPFLRIAPGTFANEYGEILQTTGILLCGWLYLIPQSAAMRRWRPAYLVLLGVLVTALIINFTRASWLVFSVGALSIFVLARLAWFRIGLLTLAFGAILRGLFYLSNRIAEANLVVSVGERFGELSDVTTSSAGQRLDTWQVAWEAFLEHPWIGNGWGLYVFTHNVPLQLLAEVGLLGFIAFYTLMAWVGWRMFRAWRQAQDPFLKGMQVSLLLAFGGCLAFDLTNHGVFHFVLWLTIALGLANARLIGAESQAREASVPL